MFFMFCFCYERKIIKFISQNLVTHTLKRNRRKKSREFAIAMILCSAKERGKNRGR